MATLQINPCNLCPRLCGARREEGEAGACGATGRMRIARAALHYWEEPPLSGEAGSGAVFFSHCPLRCVYCQNALIAQGRAGSEVGIERLAEICLELQGDGALNVNFVTPTHYALQICEAVSMAREGGLRIPVVWNTSGYERVEAIQALENTVDVYLADFKYADAQLARRYSHAPDYPHVAIEAIEKMVELTGPSRYDGVGGHPRMTRGVVVRHLLLPKAIENSRRALELLWSRFGNDVVYSIMNQYTPVIKGHPQLSANVSAEEYEQLLDFADSIGMDDYYWQEGSAAKESFIPEWDGTGVD